MDVTLWNYYSEMRCILTPRARAVPLPPFSPFKICHPSSVQLNPLRANRSSFALFFSFLSKADLWRFMEVSLSRCKRNTLADTILVRESHFSPNPRPCVCVRALLKFIVAAQQHRFLVIVLRNRGDALVRGVSPLRRWHRHVLRIVRIVAGYSHATLSFRAP